MIYIIVQIYTKKTNYNFWTNYKFTLVLGLYGREKIYAATYFDAPTEYASTAFKLFRNYDGKKSTFGDISVDAISSKIPYATVYASTEKANNDSVMHIIVIAKDLQQAINGSFTINGSIKYDKAKIYYFDNSSPDLSLLVR